MAHVQSPATAAERLAELPGRLERQEGFAEVVAELARGGQATLEGAWGSSCALIAAALAERAAGPLVVVLPQPDDVDDFLDDLAVFSRCCSLRFPALEAAPLEAELHDELGGERLRALKALAGASGPRVVAASIQGLLQPVPSKDSLAAGTRQLAVGRTLEAEPFLRWLAERGFHATTAVQLPGEFSPRGGLIDIFAPEWTEPVRIELFGDEIASLRRFDVATQRSLDVLSAIDVTVPPGETPREHFASHLPAGSPFMLVETPRLEDEGRRYLARLDEAQRLHTVADVLRQTRRFGTAYVSSLASGMLGATCRLPIGSVEQFSGDFA
jgi:transcription-repair coupling factor (superfamily II helicase)